MIAEIHELPPPADPAVFESLCLELWGFLWQDSGAQKNGRTGQKQRGVDVYGQQDGQWMGVQCKQKDPLLGTAVTVTELEAEVAAALKFLPPLSKLILATTGPRDAKVQERARQLTVEHQRQGLFKVEVWSWREIWPELCRHQDLLERIGPKYWPYHFGQNPLRNLHQLPPPPPAFTGREDELADLEQQLASAAGATISATQKHAGLQGMGGLGKTALALVLADRFKARYPDAQLFLNLRGADPDQRPPVPPAEIMAAVIHAFHPTAQLPEPLDALAPIYRSVLADAGRVLLLLDNAAGADQVRPLLPPPNCLLLVTSRAQFSLPGLAARNLDCLPAGKSQELLCKLAARFPVASAEVQTAAVLCGHLPLALEVFAGAVNDKRLTPVPELLDRLRARQEKLAPVDAAFQVSYELLTEELRRSWRLLAVFPASFDLRAATAVWGAALTPALSHPMGEGESSAAAERQHTSGAEPVSPSPWGEGRGAGERSSVSEKHLNLDSARDTMQSLVNASLVEWNPANGRFRLHDLIRQFCETKLREPEAPPASGIRPLASDETAARLRHAAHYRDVGDEAQQLYLKGGDNVLRGLELFDHERSHLEAAFEFLWALVGTRCRASQTSGPSGNSALPPDESAALLISLVDAVVYTGDLRFHPRQRIRWLEAQRAAARLAKDREAQGRALGNLGICYKNLGNARKAIEFYEQALVIARELGDRRGEGTALGNLGSAYADLGDARKAIEFYEQHRDIAREIGDRRGEGNALGNLGNAYFALGDARKAIEFYEQALVIDRELGDRRGEGQDLGNLGSAYFDLREARKAIEFHEQRLVIARELGDRRGEGNALGNLGNAYAALGDARKAIEFYEQQLKIVREIGDRRGEGTALWNSALALEQLGDRAQAITRAAAALRIYEAIEDPNAAKVRAQLAQWRAA